MDGMAAVRPEQSSKGAAMVCLFGAAEPTDHYPSFRFLDGNIKSIEVSDKTREPGVSLLGYKTVQFILGRSITGENVPKILEWHDDQSLLVDYFTPEGFPCVSERLKEAIEYLEPGVHQFFPIKVVDSNGVEIATRYLWVICSSLDSVDPDETNLMLKSWRWSAEGIENPKLVFNRERIGSHQFWRDRYLGVGNIVCGPRACEYLAEIGISGLLLRNREAV